MAPPRRSWDVAVALGAALTMTLVLHACGDDGPTEPPEVPGIVGVRMIRPAAGTDAGVLLELHGPGIDSVRIPAAGPGGSGDPALRLFDRGPGSGPRRVIVAGAVEGGRILEFHVPDVRDLSAYRVVVAEVAASESYALRPTTGYKVELVPPSP